MQKKQNDVTAFNKNLQVEKQLKADFIAFLFVLWKALSLPIPTKCQIDMARKLASGDSKRFILQAFRGIGKSFITCAFVVWKLWNDPQMKIMIVSASKERADANSIFIKRIIELLPLLEHLKPRPQEGQRDSVLSFDVGPARPDHSPSVKSVGITGQLTGSRADIIIADDVETPSNSATQGSRDKLWELVKEFAAVLKPSGTIIYLGTPQTEMTLYRELENRGYNTVIWPARYPADDAAREAYGARLAPMLTNEMDEDPSLFNTPTDPVRFDDAELVEREIEYLKHGFAMQFMLNPSLADADRYPLKLRDCIVAALSDDQAPLTFQWLPNPANELTDLPNVGLKGDRFHTFHTVSNKSGDYMQKVMAIDPSGRGSDETGYAIVYVLNGYTFLMETGGFGGGYEQETLEALANKAKQWKVHEVVLESNFGDGMYTTIFRPVLHKVHQAAIVEIRAVKQKEVRIADVIEPLLGGHKLVINQAAIAKDYATARNKDGGHDIKYSMFYQFTRLTRERGALKHDDRLDAFALAIEHIRASISIDSDDGAREMTEEYIEEYMRDDRATTSGKWVDGLEGNVTMRFDDEDDGNLSGGSVFGW